MRSTLLLTALLLVGAPGAARATCMLMCEGTLMYSDCTTPPPGIWYTGDPLTFLGSCETCCSAPGGPLMCDPTAMDMTFLYVKKDGETLPGNFAQAGATCDDSGAMFLYTADSGPLTPGSYELIDDQTNFILVQFEVVEKVEVVEEVEVVEKVEVVEEDQYDCVYVEVYDTIDIVEAPDTEEEIVGEIVEPPEHDICPWPWYDTIETTDTPPPPGDTAQDVSDAGYVVCGEKKDGGGGCAAAPVGIAPWWLLLLLGLVPVRRLRA